MFIEILCFSKLFEIHSKRIKIELNCMALRTFPLDTQPPSLIFCSIFNFPFCIIHYIYGGSEWVRPCIYIVGSERMVSLGKTHIKKGFLSGRTTKVRVPPPPTKKPYSGP